VIMIRYSGRFPLLDLSNGLTEFITGINIAITPPVTQVPSIKGIRLGG